MASRTAYSTWTPQKPTLFDGHYLRNRSTLDIGVLGYIGIVQHKELSPEVLSIPPGTLCILGISEQVLRRDLCSLRVDSVGWRGVLFFQESFPLQFHRDPGVKLQSPPIP